ncbi:MAG: hypothetical protein ABIS51_18795 [Sphingomonas sp.]
MAVAPEFPVDLPDDPIDREPALGWTAIALGIATLSLGLTNAFSIESWGADLPPSATVARLMDETGHWRARMDRIGLGAPRETMHHGWKRLEEARWPDRQGAASAAREDAGAGLHG